MPAVSSGHALFRKAEGVIAITGDLQLVTWTPNPGTGTPTVSLLLSNISNLQQTPDSNPKVMLKILAKTTADAEQAESFVFNFNQPGGRAEANAIKEIIARRLNEIRSSNPAVPKLVPPKEALAAPMSLEDDKLLANIELQKSLMGQDRALHHKFMAAFGSKPSDMLFGAFNNQFWSTRIDLLRAHAINMGQRKGAYHVLSTLKPKVVNDQIKLNIDLEQLQMIFAQYPLVKRIYDSNVPPRTESEFWSNFFLSRLRKRLCGEEVLQTDRAMPLFDLPEYDGEEGLALFKREGVHVSRTINVEANEDNQGGFKGGNLKDVEMRVRKKALLIGVINSISSTIVEGTMSGDGAAATEEDVMREIQLRDLEPPKDENRITLSIKEHHSFFPSDGQAGGKMPEKTVDEVRAQMEAALGRLPTNTAGGINLRTATGFNDQSDSEDESNDNAAPRAKHVNSRAALRAAQREIIHRVTQRRNEVYSNGVNTEDLAASSGLSAEMIEKVDKVNASVLEYLRQFWDPYLSCDPDRAAENRSVVMALNQLEKDIVTLAAEANREREAAIKAKKLEVRAYYERTGNKLAWNPESVKGGEAAVEALLAGTMAAFGVTMDDYQREFCEAMVLPRGQGPRERIAFI